MKKLNLKTICFAVLLTSLSFTYKTSCSSSVYPENSKPRWAMLLERSNPTIKEYKEIGLSRYHSIERQQALIDEMVDGFMTNKPIIIAKHTLRRIIFIRPPYE